MIDVREQDLETIKQILRKHVPFCEVWAFGSRVTGTARNYSDLDLAIVGTSKLQAKVLSYLKEDMGTSVLPFRVDVLDWHRISNSFRNVINEKYETIQTIHTNR